MQKKIWRLYFLNVKPPDQRAASFWSTVARMMSTRIYYSFWRRWNDSGEDQNHWSPNPNVYSMSSAHRNGYGNGKCAEFASHGVDFLIEKMWDRNMADSLDDGSKRKCSNRQKNLYGLSFVIYSLSEYTLATGDVVVSNTPKRRSIWSKNIAPTRCMGLLGNVWAKLGSMSPGSGGGDRKTLVFTCTWWSRYHPLWVQPQIPSFRKLKEIIQILAQRILHPQYATGISQFWADWSVAPQIKFDIIWGWDRFAEVAKKKHAEDNTSYGHNVGI